ncbi:14-3-3 protein 10-like [Camellia sinensis]|uniref:14-3-3 protein 10-like n=1 Tax=Camellia sinensis TaxID=4442 RepID=UPI001035B795|nr:14-3-3 protein 10-like [Camellia sinensis]
MSDAQKEHASTVEDLVPNFAALRHQTCSSLSEEKFWMIYFILLLPRLHEHDAKLLSTPEIVEARQILLQKLYENRNVIGSLRAAWCCQGLPAMKEESRKNDDHVVLVKDYRSKVESELSLVCAGILNLLDSNLVPSATATESKVFYLKMKGDYHRYLAEFKVGDERKEAAEDTMNAYKAAQDVALTDLAPTHPIRLGLALNFSVFYYEILNSSDKACNMAKQVYFTPSYFWFEMQSLDSLQHDMTRQAEITNMLQQQQKELHEIEAQIKDAMKQGIIIDDKELAKRPFVHSSNAAEGNTATRPSEVLTLEGGVSLSLGIPGESSERNYDPSHYIVPVTQTRLEVVLPTLMDINVVREDGPSQGLDDLADMEEDLDNLQFFKEQDQGNLQIGWFDLSLSTDNRGWLNNESDK